MTTLVYIPAVFGMSKEVYLILILLGIPIFFICRWIFAKFIKNKKSRIIATWEVTLFTVPLIFIVILIIWFSDVTCYP